jgi:hypothetical protein
MRWFAIIIASNLIIRGTIITIEAKGRATIIATFIAIKPCN